LKRKRSKSKVEISERCCAKRANGEQCSRRKKDEDSYCGTHAKFSSAFTGEEQIMNFNEHSVSENEKQQSVHIWAQEIKGIVFYIDSESNVYKMEDIMSGKSNPEIIAKYNKQYMNGSETYSIPDLYV
jgi:hypothetical protein